MEITTGYSEKPLVKKLGIKEGMSIYINNAPDNYYNLVGELPPETYLVSRLSKEIDFIHIFSKSKDDFSGKLKQAKNHLKKDGMMWISWPKKSSKVKTDLDENKIREIGLKEGLVDIKVCSIDEIWSGLKFVYRLKER